MPRRPSRTVPTVLLPGPFGAGGEDWQTWLAGCLTALRQSLAGLPDLGFDLLAHSAACLLWLHHAVGAHGGSTAADDGSGHGPDAGSAPRPDRVALVAPPAPDRPLPAWDFLRPVPLAVDALRHAADGTVLVGGADDPHCPGGVAQVFGAPLKMATTVIPGAGSLTAADGYGPWPAVLDWCGRDNLAFLA